MLVAEIGTFAQSVISSDYNGENQPPRKKYQALFNASLLGTCQVLGVPQGYMNYGSCLLGKLRSRGLKSARPTWF